MIQDDMGKPNTSGWSARKKTAFGCVVLSFWVATCASAWLLRPDLFAGADAPAETVLLVGCDSTGLTDSLFVVYSHVRRRSMRLLSVPRDTLVGGNAKINSVMRRSGTAELKRSVEAVVGHKISHVMVVPMQNVPAFLDEMCPDGVAIDVPFPMRYTDHSAGLSYSIPQGRQVLHGQSLLWYLRDRSDKQGDIARAPRQVQAMRSVGMELLARHWLHLGRVGERARQYFPTDLTDAHIIDLARNYRAAGNVSFARLAGAPLKSGNVSYYRIDANAARQQAEFALRGIVAPEDLVVLNATSTPHLAREAARTLSNRLGLAACDIGNARTALGGTTVIRYNRRALFGAAEEAARVLHVHAEYREESSGSADAAPNSRMVIEVGSDFHPERIMAL